MLLMSFLRTCVKASSKRITIKCVERYHCVPSSRRRPEKNDKKTFGQVSLCAYNRHAEEVQNLTRKCFELYVVHLKSARRRPEKRMIRKCCEQVFKKASNHMCQGSPV